MMFPHARAARNSVLSIVAGLLLVASNSATAGLTYFSRANCLGFNESISWDAWDSHRLRTYSYHYKDGVFQHSLDTGWEDTWSSYAGHLVEGFGGWRVVGSHYIWRSSTGELWMGQTVATDCNLSQW